MAKFSIIKAASAKRPERVVEWPGPERKPDGSVVEFALRPIGADDEALIIERATAFAEKRGARNPKRGDALYDLGAMLNAIALSAVDLESPAEARELFFKDAEELRVSSQRETVIYLYERLEVFQVETSPFRYQFTARELLDAAESEAASVDDRFFGQLEPSLRWSFTHSLASLVVKCPEARSLLTSLFADSTTPTSPTPSSESKPDSETSPAPASPTLPTPSLTTPLAAEPASEPKPTA